MRKQHTCLADFHFHEKLGEGSYSTVFRVTRKADGFVYSLKKVKIIDGLSDKERENSVNEVRILASIKSNKNVIGYYEAFMDQEDGEFAPMLCIVMELADDGDLF
jgi:NIMA (never in mitosis gene a)-related kinase